MPEEFVDGDSGKFLGRPFNDEHAALMRNVAASFGRTYPDIDVDDLEQTLCLWWYTRYTEVFDGYLDKPWEDQKALLIGVFTNRAIDYCQAEMRALKKLYPRSLDFYLYSRDQLINMLPFVESPEAWSALAVKHDPSARSGGKQDPALGNNALAHYADLRCAWDGLTEGDRKILRLRFIEGYESEEIADMLGISKDYERKKVERALTRMQKTLGGSGRQRRSVSNAQAQVLTRRTYDGT